MLQFAILLLCGLITLFWAPSTSSTGATCNPSELKSAQSKDVADMEAAIIRGINAIRAQHAINSLKTSNALTLVARVHSCSMAESGRISHTGVSGSTAEERVRKAGIDFTMMGENIAMTENIKPAVDQMIDDWISSPGHRKNILTPAYTETGVGVWKKGNAIYATQLFLRP